MIVKPIGIAIHGGAGTILRSAMDEEKEKYCREVLQQALEEGYSMLEGGKSSIDAVVSAVRFMEDEPMFNAGKGSVFTGEGKIEMDASVMDGNKLEAGAVAAVRGIKNPVMAALEVMLHSKHILLCREGAEAFARERGIAFEKPRYFFTEYRWNQLVKALEHDELSLDHSDKKFGTVGAVAIDRGGNLAAATSTGGMTNKKYGRVGDTPLIGAGTYADNKTCAVSCTGHGEFFMKMLTAYDISCLMAYKNYTLARACQLALRKLGKSGGTGGVIAVDNKGNIEMPFISKGMYRACKAEGKTAFTGIFRE